ncbi:EF-hand calcium-binding domain-containing protein 6 [Heteronotia binoei]|uniref:EF-hand calcium-binding domain-containing protein 6 n=1 Tax=Heteronotia binoei TaxID=13085 RepID=UPI00292F809C|nr:EF-hand calcium-binding domain-containing protein 6 [Heteronotia binoei]
MKFSIMSRVMSSLDYSSLCPQSHGIVFNSRLQATADKSANFSRQSSLKSASTASISSAPNPTLSSEDIDEILLRKMAAKQDELKKAFQTVDIDQTLKVTKGEFRRVLETFIFPLTQEQFDGVLAKIPGRSKVTVPYFEFLSRFTKPIRILCTKWHSAGDSRSRTLSQLECLLREKISKKLKHFIKTCRLFDYNQNGQIQRHELRRILEVNCFKMTDCEFDKLWNRYCICRTNTLDYKEFLQYLGINLDKKKKRIMENQDSVQNQNGSPENEKSQSKLHSPTTPGYNLTKIHLDGIAKDFREKLCSVYQDLVKAFRAFDVGRSGFVSLEYLKSVLNTFIFPIRTDVFQELMNRFGIKLSKSMAWERFLDKFQDPITFDCHQASPTRKHGRSRKLDEAFSSDRILLKLHGHIQDAYSSLKKAFLILDRNQNGKITKNELRRILDCIMFQISDDDFEELIKIIDPEHTGQLSYNKFLNLFEDQDSITDSKWINGTKKTKKPSAVLEAWNIAEDVLTEQIKGYWNEFDKALQACDPRKTGVISRNNFRKVLQIYSPSLTDDHFIALYQKYQDDTTEGVLYRMLLHSLGVADLPKELMAMVNSPSSHRSQQREEKRQMDLSERATAAARLYLQVRALTACQHPYNSPGSPMTDQVAGGVDPLSGLLAQVQQLTQAVITLQQQTASNATALAAAAAPPSRCPVSVPDKFEGSLGEFPAFLAQSGRRPPSPDSRGEAPSAHPQPVPVLWRSWTFCKYLSSQIAAPRKLRCPGKRPAPGLVGAPDLGHFLRASSSVDPPPTPFLVPIHLQLPDGRWIFVHAMLDSGAACCYMDHLFAKKHGIPIREKKTPALVEVVDSRLLRSGPVRHETQPLALWVQQHQGEQTFDLSRMPRFPVILGLSWLQAHNPHVDWVQRELQFPAPYQEFADVFDEKEADQLPPHRPYDCAIDLMPGAPLPAGRLYPMADPELVALWEYLEKNLARGFIRPSTSPLSSPVLFVKKKTGDLRLCNDYRALNKITIRNRYPLPLIPELLDRVKGATIYTKLDLRGAYNLVRIKAGEEWKTAFEQEHVQHVRQVLQRLRAHRLYAKLEKCAFHLPSVEFLGHIISPQGTQMDPKKVDAILQWQAPHNRKDVQRLLGFANYYRQFIAGYANLTKPLTRLLCPKEPFQWTPEADQAFHDLKRSFSSSPLLRYPDPRLPFMMAHFVPCAKVPSGPETAQLYLNHVFRLHGLPKQIVSDRGPQFTSRFWQAFQQGLGTELHLSSAYHPQTDGQTERTNATLEQYLRCYTSYQQDNWASLLPLAEFAYNNAVHSSTQTTPFAANYGLHPRFFPPLGPSADVPAADNRIEELHLTARFIGPFPIEAQINPVAFRLRLPAHLRIHPVFHRSLLQPAAAPDPNRDVPPPPPPPVLVDDDEEYEVLIDSRVKQIEDCAYKYTKNRIVDEVIERLRDGILQREAYLRDCFLCYNKQAGGKLSKTDFRKLLEDIGMPMEDDQFKLLIEKIGFPNGGLSYLDFVAIFEDSRLTGLGHGTLQENTSKCHFVSAEECLSRFSDKLVEEYGDPYIAFRKIDRNHDGIVTMLDFRSLLDTLCISMTDEEYTRLLGISGMNVTSTLNYPEFFQLFQEHATKDIRPWLTPSYKPKQTAADADLACEQAHHYLCIKAQNRWNDLAMYFHEYDSDGNNIVLKKDLKDVLYRCGMPINPKEFEKIWARYDVNGKGYLTHQEFLQKLGVQHTPPSTGLNRQYTEDNCVPFMNHYKIIEKKETDINEIENKIREKYQDNSQDFHKALLQQDSNREGYITVDKLHKMLENFKCCLDYQQYSELLYRLGISIQDNKLSYFDFLRSIGDRGAFRRKKRILPPVPPISFMQLSTDEAMMRIKQIVTASSDLLYKAFSAFDKDNTGAISAQDFRQVLHHFCFTLSEKQFNLLLRLQRLRGEHSIDWKYFLQKFNFLSETEREHMKFACWELTNQQVLDRIKEVVNARFQAVEQEFKNADCTRANVVSKEDFRDICHRRFMLLTDQQFESLWNMVPLALNGKLKYPAFLKKFSIEASEMPDTLSANNFESSEIPATLAEPASQLPSRPKTASPLPSPNKKPDANRPYTAAVQTPPILNCKPIESKIQRNVQHCWKDMLKDCREKDVDRLGEIPTEDFLTIAEKFHLNLTKEESKQLITKYDFKSVGKFAYCDFLQSCVLLLKQQDTSPLQRTVIQSPQIQESSGPQTPTFLNAMMRIQPQILQCWRPMRRTFKMYDISGNGLLSTQDFRQVLRKYSVNLSEEEFFHILEYYDKALTSQISYNEFLRAFLQ